MTTTTTAQETFTTTIHGIELRSMNGFGTVVCASTGRLLGAFRERPEGGWKCWHRGSNPALASVAYSRVKLARFFRP